LPVGPVEHVDGVPAEHFRHPHGEVSLRDAQGAFRNSACTTHSISNESTIE
jgi:hypothetical protein